MEEVKGITAIFTGDGKGKTSAALGVIARSLGHGKKCKIIQFIKGRRLSGEHYLAERLAPDLEIVMTGKGFTWLADVSREEHEKSAQDGLKLAGEAITSGEYAVVALDEILYALKSGLVKIEQVEWLMDLRLEGSHLILTGRGAPQRLIDKADLVTSMQVIKHHKQTGVPAQICMDY